MTLALQSTEIWEKQSYDSNTGYDYFWKYYVNSEEGKRGYVHAYNTFRQERGKPPAKHIPGNWTLWCKGINKNGKRLPHRHTWAERYAAYEAFVAEEKQKALHQKIFDDAQEWAAMQETSLEKERDYAERLYGMADKMLQGPVFSRRSGIGQNGETQVFIEPAGWKLKDVVSVLRLASDLYRRGLLMPRDGAMPEDRQEWAGGNPL